MLGAALFNAEIQGWSAGGGLETTQSSGVGRQSSPQLWLPDKPLARKGTGARNEMHMFLCLTEQFSIECGRYEVPQLFFACGLRFLS